MMKHCISLLLVLILLAGCDQGSEKKGTHDRLGQEQLIKVIPYDTDRALQKAKQELVGGNLDKDLKGFATWTDNIEDGCTIHILRTATHSTKGHELDHCLYGSYHEEG